MGLSVTETLLVFVGIPLAAVLVITGLTYAGSRGGATTGGGGHKRYRPGRPFDFTPVWFLGRPEQLADSAGTALTAGAQAPALTSRKLEQASVEAPAGGTGGASDRW
ncbi:aa3-type cytochrome oxidase subunit CtaJ [Micromonospora chokoriensis]|uniref:aa3-type cytochrome oxidase subunit CtaJ n=1 Tax=Micromonospora sp. WMMC250 TaxID=3014781 RepID=UPI003FA5FE55